MDLSFIIPRRQLYLGLNDSRGGTSTASPAFESWMAMRRRYSSTWDFGVSGRYCQLQFARSKLHPRARTLPARTSALLLYGHALTAVLFLSRLPRPVSDIALCPTLPPSVARCPPPVACCPPPDHRHAAPSPGTAELADDAPCSVSERWFDVVCPLPEHRLISRISSQPASSPARWATRVRPLATARARAPHRSRPQPTGTRQIQVLARCLTSTFGAPRTSSLLEPRDLADLAPARPLADRAARARKQCGPLCPAVRDPYARMLAVHVWRGDYVAHCAVRNLILWAAAPALKVPPADVDSLAHEDAVLAHCLPTVAQLVRCINASMSRSA
ncbi:hypothetical protein GGX14DRAFT_556914 [Mycena pura]|uniref:Uncharacterized protein n=1 Tax=Mycena pura TaxID=153505 RepID=A0AAD6YQK9_9AGAR|nr:hypothetical protein GGX14DRAFT_556914 [Mycena pura]